MIQTRKLVGVTWMSTELMADYSYISVSDLIRKALRQRNPIVEIRLAARQASDAYSKILLAGIE